MPAGSASRRRSSCRAARPFTKIDRTEALGAKVVLKGEGLTEARRAADDWRTSAASASCILMTIAAVIAGQGTIALEMLADCADLDALVVPIGGGGLISGIAVAAKALAPTHRDHRRAVRALPLDVPHACTASSRRAADRGQTFAEGIAVKEPGTLTRAHRRGTRRRYSARHESASSKRAVELLLERQKLVVEGAGAASLAALLAESRAFPRPPRRHRPVAAAISTRGCSPRS